MLAGVLAESDMNAPTLKRRGLLGLIAALPIFGRSAQAGPPSFELAPAIQARQHWTFAFERKVTRDGAVMHWYRSTLRLRVLDADDGATIEWIEGDQAVVDAHPQRRPLLELGLAAMRDVPLVIGLDAAGRVSALHNADAVRAASLDMLDAAAAHFGAQTEAAPVIAAMLPAMKATLATEAMVTAAALKEPLLLLSAMGRRFGADEPVEFRTTLVNPMGGEALDAIARFRIHGVDSRAGQATLGWLMVSDPVATDAASRANVLRGAAIAGVADAPATADAIAALPAFSLEERGDYVVDTASAWPVRVTHARTVRAGPHAQVEETSFRRA